MREGEAIEREAVSDDALLAAAKRHGNMMSERKKNTM